MAIKGGKWFLWLSILALVFLVVLLFLFYALYSPNNEKLYEGANIVNPVQNLSVQEAVSNFDESYLFYLLYTLKAYNLRNEPLTSNVPKIALSLDESKYYAVIQNGLIKIFPGESEGADIIIKSTKEEIVGMLKDSNYVQTSFNSGRSGIELVASKSRLFAKGYLKLYNEATGKSITGNIIRIYVG